MAKAEMTEQKVLIDSARQYAKSLGKDVKYFNQYVKEYFEAGPKVAMENLKGQSTNEVAVETAREFHQSVINHYDAKIEKLTVVQDPPLALRKERLLTEFYKDAVTAGEPKTALRNALSKISKDEELSSDQEFVQKLRKDADAMEPKQKQGGYNGKISPSNDLLFTFNTTTRDRYVKKISSEEIKKLVTQSLDSLVQKHLAFDGKTKQPLTSKGQINKEYNIDLEVGSIMNRNFTNPAIELAFRDSAEWGHKLNEANQELKANSRRYSKFFMTENTAEHRKLYSEYIEKMGKESIARPHELSGTDVVEIIRAGIRESGERSHTNTLDRIHSFLEKKIKEQAIYPDTANKLTEVSNQVDKLRKCGVQHFDLKTGSEVMAVAYSQFLPINFGSQDEMVNIKKETRLLLNGVKCATVGISRKEIDSKQTQYKLCKSILSDMDEKMNLKEIESKLQGKSKVQDIGEVKERKIEKPRSIGFINRIEKGPNIEPPGLPLN